MKLNLTYPLLAAAATALLSGGGTAQLQSSSPSRPNSGVNPKETDNREISLSWLRNAGATWAGSEAGAGIGRNISAAGDVNGDGIDDLLVSAYDDEGTAAPGTVFLIFGGHNNLPELFTLTTPEPSTVSPPRTSGVGPIQGAGTGDPGFVVILGSQTGDRTGAGLAAAGDVNGDGIGDFLVGAPYFDGAAGTDSGIVYLIYGTEDWAETLDLADLATGQATIFEGPNGDDRLGNSVTGVSDMNGDGTPDIALGAYYASPFSGGGGINPTITHAGQVFVVFGSNALGESFSLTGMGSAGFPIYGDGFGDQAGHSIASAGDMNGDGLGDLIIGAPFHAAAGHDQAGAAYVVLGNTGLGSRIDLDTLLTDGMTLLGSSAGYQLGWTVAGGSDFNGDGHDDIAVGAPGYDVSSFSQSNEGQLVLVYGAGSLPYKLVVNELNEAASGSSGHGNGFNPTGSGGGSSRVSGLNGSYQQKPIGGSIITGANVGARTGSVIAMGGDINGDRLGDVLIGSASTNDSYLLHGNKALPAALNLSQLAHRGVVLQDSYDTHSMAFIGDMDDDKFGDYAIGSMNALHERSFGSGTATVVKGAAHILQAQGYLYAGATFDMIVHGTPNLPFLLMVSPSVRNTAILNGRGAWWLGPYIEVLSLTHDVNGETVISVGIPALSMVSNVTVYWQTLEADTERHLDLSQLLTTTVD
jgi:hypothetical protein